MAEFTVTYTSGAQDVVTADGYRESGPWLVLTRAGRDEIVLSVESVRRIDRTDPAPSLKKPGRMFRLTSGVVLAGTAVFSLVVGFADAFMAKTLLARVFGAVMVVAGVACTAGVLGLVKTGADRLRWVLLGALSATAVLLALVVVQVVGMAGAVRPNALNIVLVVAAVASCVCALRLWKAGVSLRLPAPLRGLLAVGVIVGLFEFWYTTEYLPANVDPGVNVFVELAAGAVPDDKLLPEYVTATITLENVSDTRVLVVGSQYYLSALSMHLEIPPSAQEGADPITGTFFDDENWFTPGQKFVAKVVMPVPDPAPPILRFDTALHVARASRLRLGRRVPFGWEIQESSLVNRITRERRYLIQDRRGRLRTCISAQQNPECPGENRRLDEVYGRMVVETGTVLVLEKAATGRAAP